MENLARDRAKKLFGVDHANVQAYSGSPANQGGVFLPCAIQGDTVMGLALYYGGHMTHGLKSEFFGTLYNSVQPDWQDGYLDYEAIGAMAMEHSQNYSSVPRRIRVSMIGKSCVILPMPVWGVLAR